MSQQEQANAMAEWEEFAVDLDNRQATFRTLSEKTQCLQRVKERNDRLEVYLNEL
jgi:L-amino acid N-acyltransferase YncA